jgi:3-oxoacyl-[acyl-carrier-protein] synthase II
MIESPHPTSKLPDAAGHHRRRVVVTGIGMLTPMGMGVNENAEGFRLGKSALRPITLFDTSRMRVHSGGELSLPGALPDTNLSPRETVRLDRSSKMLLHAAAEALTQSDWLTEGEERSAALVFGTSAGAMALGEDFYRHALTATIRRARC